MVLQFLYGPICRADNDFGSGLILAFYSNRFCSIIVSTYLLIVKLSIIHS